MHSKSQIQKNYLAALATYTRISGDFVPSSENDDSAVTKWCKNFDEAQQALLIAEEVLIEWHISYVSNLVRFSDRSTIRSFVLLAAQMCDRETIKKDFKSQLIKNALQM